MKWERVEDPPAPGERVLVCNDVREWVTHWNPALVSDYVLHPVTHYARIERPYPSTAPDLTAMEARRSRSIADNALQRIRGRR